jgi:hypothetical protein
VAKLPPRPPGTAEADYRSVTVYDAIDRPVLHTPATRGMSVSELERLSIVPTALSYDESPTEQGALSTVSMPPAGSGATILRVSYDYTASGQVAARSGALLRRDPSALPCSKP